MHAMMRRILCLLLGLGFTGSVHSQSTPVPIPNPIMFVTQVPIPGDFTSIGSVFGNHKTTMDSVGRGGDLWIRYPSGTLKNITQTAGFGTAGFQGATSIAVRDPAIHWNGQKAVFAMVVGAVAQQYQVQTFRWQLYEVTGLGEFDQPVITIVPFQPSNYNNISPAYASNGRIIFTSDRPRDGQSHLYPQRDEYEIAPTVSGVYSLDPQSGDLRLLNHAPSGDFTPIVDSFGRVVFTQWDHLQRDQEADADFGQANPPYGMFNWSGEAASSVPTNSVAEVFPEPRPSRPDLLAGTNLLGHTFNHFFPWQMNQDGTDVETLNHIGRHELHGYFNKSMSGDPNLTEFISASSSRFNPRDLENFLQIKEDPTTPGRYIGVDAPEFQTHAAGQVVAMTIPPGTNPDLVAVDYLTHRDTRFPTATPSVNHTGHYRDVLPLSDGSFFAVHTPQTDADQNIGTSTQPLSRYDFRIKKLVASGAYLTGGPTLTNGISKTVSYWSPDYLVSYSGVLWELQPVEIRPRPVPPATGQGFVPAPEAAAFAQAGIAPATLKNYMVQNGLALIVSRNVTTRDDADRQQPFNLKITGQSTQTLGGGGQIYDVRHMQLFQGDLIRGLGGTVSPGAGRRVLAQAMHDPAALAVNPPNATGPAGSVMLGNDGSMAAFVPARRAMTWQLTNSAGTGIVRERYWLTFQPGEIRVCASCHGVNTHDQSGANAPQTTPQALVQLLNWWQSVTGPVLGANAAGTVGQSSGQVTPVLAIDGLSGGQGHRVDLALGASPTVGVLRPPAAASSQPFAVWGMLGVPGAGNAYASPIGTFLFTPQLVDPNDPLLFTLADTFFADPRALLASGPTPYAAQLPTIPFPFTVTLQGAIADPPSPTSGLSITNGLILRVQ